MSDIDFLPIEGSHIKGMSYDPETRVLSIKFVGGIYRYEDVPPEVHEQLHDANEDPDRSLGKEFRALIMKGGYEYTKL